MTEPAPVVAPVPIDWTNRPIFCVGCEVHQATSLRPLCPVCQDEDARAKREAS